ncbi:MAG: Stp1/IreP family PP2C-type Ser/Thr phosphatase [Candidatus Eisenbacteria bacterium]|uniref:Stp1/IreP family PP2C-type Ser/Thr phosphatase n=1 Tax=Eiseniibacteriota bacterium TaxID=2212470 RepID=A0A933S9U8_UNCEI|nr:Stp1/IreP family PP2C-type Ser/Thr phosphatase [Candidatus Eisenbacteria bacterium]
MMIKIEAEGLQLATLTDVGRKRSGNEDSHAVWVSEEPAEFARRGALLVVADGMGGANAGEVASRLAADTVIETYRADTSGDPARALQVAIETANSRVHSQSVANHDQRGMGTTCTAVVVRGDKVWIGHVGDSRAYLVREGETHRLTSDHSLVAELVERGHLTEQEARHDPRRNVVTRSVGALADVQVDAGPIDEPLRPGDRIVICSDGLHGQVSDSEIAMLAGDQEPDEACQSLIDLANERGGPDNITVIVARIPGVAGAVRHDAESAATTTLVLEPEHVHAAEAPKKAPAKSAAPVGGSPMLPKLLLALVVLVALVAVIATQVFKRVGGASDTAATPDSGIAGESVMPVEPPASAAAPAQDAPQEEDAPAVADATPATPAAPVRSAQPAPDKPAVPPAKTPASKPFGKTVPVPVAAPVAAKEPAVEEPKVETVVLIVTRPFQPAMFQVDGQLHSQDVGSVTLRDLSPGSHSAHVEDSRGRGVTMTFNVGDAPSKELVALLPGFDKVGDLDVVLNGAESARLYIDGAQYPRMAPCVVRGLAPGPHKIRAFNPKTRRTSDVTDAEVRAGGTTRVEIVFPQ